jgi:malate permease and related proteins
MSSSAGIIQAVAPVFLLIGLGFFLRRIEFFTAFSVEALSGLVFYVAVPALLYHSIAESDLARSFDWVVILTAWPLVAGVTFLFYRFSVRLPPGERGSLVQGSFRSNLAFVGLPIIVGAYGPEGLAPAAVFTGLMVPLFNFLAVLVLLLPHHSADSRQGLSAIARSLVLNPFIIGSGLGIAAAATHFVLPEVINSAVNYVGQIALPLALLALGGSLEFQRLRARIGLIAIAAAFKLLIYPGLFLLSLTLCHRSGLLVKVPVFLLATPTAVVSFITAREMRGSEEMASGIVLATTLASVFTMPLWLYALQYF